MLCSVYKSGKKEGMYLYISKKDDFSSVPETLMQMFGTPKFVMVMKMEGRKLATVDIEKVKQSLQDDGFFLQLPPPPVNLLEEYKANKQNRS
ncbi:MULTISPECIES: YcgL domain-containing protein [Vibrio]|uniref:YcgL domain-containing protein GFB47_07485 n=1 Tax=Vibrio algicola TaxID=2662262 RepID=A0A5Q0TIX5_9VIBR|nr:MULTISPECIES: YcgL domain-containing protein [Vibrio]MBD1575533.1 YcgL domain-containing protein [Vibrio sp. S11_S32]